MKRFKMLFMGVFLAGFCLSIVACDSSSAALNRGISNKSIELSGSMIKSFSANPEIIAPGEMTTISWVVTDAESIEVSGFTKLPDVVLELEDSYPAWPEETTTFTLTAYGANGEVEIQSIVVTVDPDRPYIEEFYAEPATITNGEETTVYWKVSNADELYIDGFEKIPDWVWPMQGSLPAAPEETTTFTLTAQGNNGVIVRKSIVVNVEYNGPRVISFTASDYFITQGQMVTLAWETEDAVTCTLMTSTGYVLPNRPVTGQISLFPGQTTTYTIVATDEDGNEAEKSITIVVYE